MRRPVIQFGGIFFLCLLGFSAFFVMTDLPNRLGGLENRIAALSWWIARLAGSGAELVDGNNIVAGGMNLIINHECTGVFVLVVLVSFIVAYPARLWLRLVGVGVGIVGLTFLNVLRIATLVRIVEFYPQAFVYFHEYVWQGVFLMLVTLYAITWVEWTQR